MPETFEHVVIGAGALGSATAFRLAEAGSRSVLVLEQFRLAHGNGSQDDHSRIIRHAYHSEIYTPMTQATFDAWAEVEELTELSLVTTTGGLDFAVKGTAGEAELANYRDTLAPGVGYEMLDAGQIRVRYPQWRISEDTIAMYQENGGLLDIRRAGFAHRALARQRGVEFREETPALRLEPHDSHVVVHTKDEEIHAESVILCTASWAPDLLTPLGIDWNWTVSQEQVSYFASANVREFMPDGFPVWIWHGETLFYGFPVYGEVGVKVSRDVSGLWVTPQTRSFEPNPAETALFADFLQEHLPAAVGPELYSKTCLYDMAPDRDFILDKLPGQPRITVGFGGGHAAKFAALIGKILTQIAIEGKSTYPIAPFGADRPALTDPGFEPVFRLQG